MKKLLILLTLFGFFTEKAHSVTSKNTLLKNIDGTPPYKRPFDVYLGLGMAGINRQTKKENYQENYYTKIKTKNDSSPIYMDFGFKVNFSFIFAGVGAGFYSKDKQKEVNGILGIYITSQASLYLTAGKAQIRGWHSDMIKKYSPAFLGIGFEYNINPKMSISLEILEYKRKKELDTVKYWISPAPGKENKVKVEQSGLKLGVKFYPLNF